MQIVWCRKTILSPVKILTQAILSILFQSVKKSKLLDFHGVTKVMRSPKDGRCRIKRKRQYRKYILSDEWPGHI